MKSFNIYLIGVGGQGIGLLSEILLRAADHAGLKVKGVDTHGLAQRGGIVVSRVRIGENAHSPLIPSGQADMVVALERHEALRGMNSILKDSGTLVYYDVVWQPLDVRLKKEGEVSVDTIREQGEKRGIKIVKVFKKDLVNARMQNIVLLGHLDGRHLIPDVDTGHFRQAMDDLMSGRMLEKNMALFEEVRTGQGA
jgi:indolepyruvate ferredoxin oxidoreductase beta subunit